MYSSNRMNYALFGKINFCSISTRFEMHFWIALQLQHINDPAPEKKNRKRRK